MGGVSRRSDLWSGRWPVKEKGRKKEKKREENEIAQQSGILQ
jgi:hypothetical protein